MTSLEYTSRRYGFNVAHRVRFEAAQRFELPCDWCKFAFTLAHGPQVDHDHSCPCSQRLSRKAKNSCTLCIRGFVHLQCNREIGALEWREEQFGEVSTKLTAYRANFSTSVW